MWGWTGWAGFRQRRSTAATRAFGVASYVLAFAAVLWKYLDYWGPAPRWDLIALIAAVALCGLAWLGFSMRAPCVPAVGEPAITDAAGWQQGPVPALPRRIPGPGLGLAGLRGAAVGLLLTLSGAFAITVAMGPDGDIGRQAGEIDAQGGVVGNVIVTRVMGDPQTEGSVKSGFRCVSDLVVRILGASGPAGEVSVPGAVTVSCPNVGDAIQAYYAPGHLDLGAVIHTNSGHEFDGLPAEPADLALTVVIFSLAGIGLGAAGGRGTALWPGAPERGGFISRGGPQMLRADLRAGRARAARAMITGAGRVQRIEPGSRLGSEKRLAEAPFLTVAVAANDGVATQSTTSTTSAKSTDDAWRLTPIAGYDPSVVADDFTGASGWLCWPDRWKLFAYRPIPLVFIADDGRVLWCSTDPMHRSRFDGDVDRYDRPAPAFDSAQVHQRPLPALSLPRYGRFHPALHVPAVAVLAVGLAATLIRLAIYPSTLTSWLLWLPMMAAPILGCILASPRIVSARRMRRLLPTISVEVIDEVPR